ncbi:hypothetical protein VT84_36655 [Gemmata sp. SH-PL17]|uniref:hypothetical protein n=1 Tax=Gemmata sp. SH-PL17 TaxID=1630693 RepID=UPI0004B75BE7|nr:hypothetical protein [Gemmata sp. SH-PL17]AMV29982.1 hypothetical protein VT84_36655 [Gemmata sp. SH-PL17]
MHVIAIALAVIGALGSTSIGRAGDDHKELVVGVWEIAYSDAKDVPIGTRLEFTKDGKMNRIVKADGKEVVRNDGGYTVEKDVITLTGSDGKKNDKGRICLLNKTSFVINDEAEDKVMILKRVKAK